MAASREDIRLWLETGKANNATHVLVICDQMDWEDYPVYVMPGEDPQEIIRRDYTGSTNALKLMECYSLTGRYSIESQMLEPRAFHYD